jgi:hypothetical protein
MKFFVWAVWRRCRLVGYIKAYSEWEAQSKSESQFGKEIFIIRHSATDNSFVEDDLAHPVS